MLWAAWFHTFLPHFCHFSPPVSQCAVGALGRMILLVSDFSPTCLRLASDLFAIPWKRWVAWCYNCFQLISQYAVGALGHMNLHFSPIYAQGGLGHLNLNLFPLSPTVSKYAVDALSRIILHLYPTCLWMLWAA